VIKTFFVVKTRLEPEMFQGVKASFLHFGKTY